MSYYEDMIDALYKEAEEEASANHIKSGVAIGAGMGAIGGFNRLSPKLKDGYTKRDLRSYNKQVKSIQDSYAPKLNTVDKAGKKALKAEMNEAIGKIPSPKAGLKTRLGTFGSRMAHGGIKTMLPRMAIGAAIGAAGGFATNKLDQYNQSHKLASEVIDDLYKYAAEDIHCERCGYEGQPTYEGRCPKCGLVLGKYEPEGPCGDAYNDTTKSYVDNFTVNELADMANAEDWALC